jgi:hypothetical protein
VISAPDRAKKKAYTSPDPGFVPFFEALNDVYQKHGK